MVPARRRSRLGGGKLAGRQSAARPLSRLIPLRFGAISKENSLPTVGAGRVLNLVVLKFEFVPKTFPGPSHKSPQFSGFLCRAVIGNGASSARGRCGGWIL